MANYLLLYHGGGIPQTNEEKQRVSGSWEAWTHEVGSAMVDTGNPTGEAKIIENTEVKDFSGARISGYSVIKAETIDDAAELARGAPIIADGGSVDVYETFSIK